MDASGWDQRYASAELVWSSTPNQWVESICSDLTPGRALDLAAGEGRNAIWLAERGWQVTATDFSSVAVDRIEALSSARLGRRADALRAVVADATTPQPSVPGGYDLVVICYLQMPTDPWRAALARAVEATAPGGHLVIVLHAAQNLSRGFGGPQDLAVLHDPQDVVADLVGLPVEVTRAELATRRVTDDAGTHEALDTIVVLRRHPGQDL